MQRNWIDQLAEITESRWAISEYSEQAFPDIAAEALEEVGAHRELTTTRLIRTVLAPIGGSHHLTRHPAPNVVTLHSNTRFQVLAHLWVDGLASLHQHGWAGAYQVVEGSSLRAHYRFEELRRVRSGFRLGKLHTELLDELRPGAVIPVPSGSRLIHGLSHVERPALSLSIRTTDPSKLALDYARPGVAYQTSHVDRDTEDRVRCLDILMHTDPSEWGEALEKVVLEHDLATVFFALKQPSLQRRLVPEKVLACGQERFGDLFKIIEHSLEDFHRTAKFESLRRSIRDHDLRFFLGVLYLAENRSEVLKLIACRYNREDPGTLLGGWLARLLIEVEGNDDGDKVDSQLPEFPQGIVQGLGDLALGSNIDAVLIKLRRTSTPEDFEDHKNFLHEAFAELRAAIVYRPLFAKNI